MTIHETLVTNPSISALAYQATTLLDALDAIQDDEHPSEACRIRDLFRVLATAAKSQLEGMYRPEDPFRLLAPPEAVRARKLGRLVQGLNSYLRYLRASSPVETPPGIQYALSYLTKRHLSTAAETICLVRPQWKYNFTYVPISDYLHKDVQADVLEPLKARVHDSTTSSVDGLLRELWENSPKLTGGAPYPAHIGALSFPRLDTEDTLLYPLLAHELGHFLDFSCGSSGRPATYSLRRYSIPKDAVIETSKRATGGGADLQRDVETGVRFNRALEVCIQELVADLLAVRMMGLSYFLAQAEFLKTLGGLDEGGLIHWKSGYPTLRFRLFVVLTHYSDANFPGSPARSFSGATGANAAIAADILSYLEQWRARLAPIGERLALASRPANDAPATLDDGLKALGERLIADALNGVEELARQLVPNERVASLTPDFFPRIENLRREVPPIMNADQADCFAEILSAAWCYQLLEGEEREARLDNPDRRCEEYRKTCRLVLKAIELIPECAGANTGNRALTNNNPASTDLLAAAQGPAAENGSPSETLAGSGSIAPSMPSAEIGGVLGRTAIRRRLAVESDTERMLAVVPIRLENIQEASIDVRLGNWFAVARRSRVTAVDPEEERDQRWIQQRGREESFVPKGNSFVIHPGDLVLGTTLEFVSLPVDVMAFVEGRSRIGRIGLLVATASQVAPGFHGVIVLEMANTGTIPIVVRPGMRIAQLVLCSVTLPEGGAKGYRGRYHCQIKP